MAELFSFGDARNHPARSGFDLSKRFLFTAKAGELLPVYWQLTFPGDKFDLKHQIFTRTQPCNTAAFTRLRQYVDWYFVPLRLLNKNLPQALVQMTANPVQASSVSTNKVITTDIPYTSFAQINALFRSLSLGTPLVNSMGFYDAPLMYKLMDYLGYGSFLTSNTIDALVKSSANGQNFYTSLGVDFPYKLYNDYSDDTVNLLPLLAYQKIYNDFVRFEQWEQNQPYTYNVDWYEGGDLFAKLVSPEQLTGYLGDDNIFTLRYSRYQKDLYMGIMPEQQLGDVATVSIDSGSTKSVGLKDTNGGFHAVLNSADTTVTTPAEAVATMKLPYLGHQYTVPKDTVFQVLPGQAVPDSFNIIALRLAEATQKWREISQCADQNYRDQIKAHFGVSLSPALSDKSIWIGGSASNIDISEVVNTNLYGQDADSVPYIKGKGIGTGQGFESFTADEHGILMAIYHVQPITDYVRLSPNPSLFYTSTEDLPVPEFDSIGLQVLPWKMFSMTNGIIYQTEGQFGYTSRFFDVKTTIDEVHGAFTTTLPNWVAPLDWKYWNNFFDNMESEEVNYKFFMVDPHVLDNIFDVKVNSQIDTDQFLINAYFDVKAVRNFDYNGMPY